MEFPLCVARRCAFESPDLWFCFTVANEPNVIDVHIFWFALVPFPFARRSLEPDQKRKTTSLILTHGS
jgi:hypothetical protein